MPLLADLNELARSGVPVTVSNQTTGIVVFNLDEANLKAAIVWGRQGDPTGDDVKQVSPNYLLSPNFRDVLLRGLLKVEDGPEALDAALAAQHANWSARQVARDTANSNVLVKEAENVVATAATCIAPKGRDGLCGTFALQNQGSESQTPPLCAEHLNLASHYTGIETGRTVAGRPEVLWKRTAAGPTGSVRTVTMLNT